jgi:uncharacterized membrane protein/2-hydroxychromene-2-carboxylate isomerase
MAFLQTEKTIKPLKFLYYFFTVVIIGLIGLGDAIYLSISHYRVYTDIGYMSFCAISRSLNCDTVSQNPYAILFNAPVPVWGVLGYAFFLILLAFAWPQKAQHKRVWATLLLISLCFTLYSIFLAVISALQIHSYCIMCILSYAVNFSLLYFTWLIRNRFQSEPVLTSISLDIRYLACFPRIMGTVTLFFGSVIIWMILFFPPYWQMSLPDLNNKIPTGMTQDGHPWIGAKNPVLEIVEFSDYQCFQCKKIHFFLRRIIQAHPEEIRLVHRHFPMDHTINPVLKQPFHIGAGKLAIISLFAAKIDKFWVMNDLLFDVARQKEAVNILDLAQKTGIADDEIKQALRDPQLWQKLRLDIQAGLSYNMTGTPGFVINGKLYMGQIPENIFREHGLIGTGTSK